MSPQSLNFSISGGLLTDLARSHVLSGDVPRAERLLLQSLSGFEIGHVNMVLSGSHRLGGEGGEVFLEEDPDSQDYKASLREKWAGTVIEGSDYWLPYAGIHLLGPEVQEEGFQEFLRHKPTHERRCLWYADSPTEDLSIAVDADVVSALFRRIPSPPSWWVETINSRVHRGGRVSAFTESFRLRESLGSIRRIKPASKDSGVSLSAEPFSEEEEEAEKDRLYLLDLSRRIQEQATELDGEDAYLQIARWKVPKRPFIAWTLWRTPALDKAPHWVPVCPEGFKMAFDVPVHSDWMQGAIPTIPAELWYSNRESDKDLRKELTDFVFSAQREIQSEYLVQRDCVVLRGSGRVFGRIIHAEPDQEIKASKAIVVIPHAGPEYYIPAHSASQRGGCVVTESGGALSHLVVVGQEDITQKEIRVILHPEALKRLTPGNLTTVDFDAGSVHWK